jgi:hypothetical protein
MKLESPRKLQRPTLKKNALFRLILSTRQTVFETDYSRIGESEKPIKPERTSVVRCDRMSLSPIKHQILEKVWMFDRPAKPAEIAKSADMKFPAVMMHLLGLARAEYLRSPEKGFYIVTEKGKRALGIPEINHQKASEILKHLPAEKSFHFYEEIGKPLNLSATSLEGFCEKIQKIELGSVEFHVRHRDFEAWFTHLGDIELAKKVSILEKQKLRGEELRRKLYELVHQRYQELLKIRGS